MKRIQEKNAVLQELRLKIMALEGFSSPEQGHALSFGLGSVEAAFPANVFPIGVIHELTSTKATEASAVSGFIAGLLGTLMKKGGFCLWISHQRTLFPAGLKRFGVDPHKVIFIDVKREKEVLWAVEQALKCDQLAAVIGEVQEISFAESQRLQLAVEQSRVTGFLHRYQPNNQNNLACATRWKITPLPSRLEDAMPGVGFTSWRVELIKVRNGRPGIWQMEWREGGFQINELPSVFTETAEERHYA